MRSLSARVPAPPGCRWSPDIADAMIGLRGELTVEPFGPLEGEVVAAVILDDEMGHALWLTVVQDTDDTGGDVISSGTIDGVSIGGLDLTSLL